MTFSKHNCFRLTIRNVNMMRWYTNNVYVESFRLTIRNVNVLKDFVEFTSIYVLD